MANESSADDPKLLQELLRMQCAAGHPHNRVLQRVLRDRGAAPEVVELAGRFRCDQCLEMLDQLPHNTVSLESERIPWRTIGMDVLEVHHPKRDVV